MTRLFSPLTLGDLTIKNRIWVSPMCQYSSNDGMPTDWHLVHLGSRAVGGAGLVMVEATAVSPEGRISPGDSGIYHDDHVPAFERITGFIRKQKSVPAIQLGHAGRKASTHAPWQGGLPLAPGHGGWQPVGPSALPFAGQYPTPREMTPADIDQTVRHFVDAARRSHDAGFGVIEIHAAHGYLIHQFLSPLSNHRTDAYGGPFENRVRLLLQIVEAVRSVWPERLPLFVRISATDWVDGGWDLAQSVKLAQALKSRGVDLIDCSSGGNVPNASIPAGPGYQVEFARSIRRGAEMPTAAVGMITSPQQAEQILTTGQADAVFLAREFLRDPYFPLHAAHTLGADVPWPDQYGRAKPS